MRSAFLGLRLSPRKSKQKRPSNLLTWRLFCAIMAGRFLRPSSGTGAFSYPRTLLLMLVIITTITVLFIEVARFRPPRWASGRRSDIDREPIFFGGSAVSVTGGSERKTGKTVIGGRTLGPRSIHRKQTSHKEVENAGLDDFWAAGFGDAETDLEGDDVLVVEKGEGFVLSAKNASSPQLFGRFRDRWEELVGSPNVETIEGRVVFWQVGAEPVCDLLGGSALITSAFCACLMEGFLCYI
jgi:hypothetical protein